MFGSVTIDFLLPRIVDYHIQKIIKPSIFHLLHTLIWVGNSISNTNHIDVRYIMHIEFKGKGNNSHFPYFLLGEHGTLVTIESQIFIIIKKIQLEAPKKLVDFFCSLKL